MPKNNGSTTAPEPTTSDARKAQHVIARENTPDSPIVKNLQRQVANAFILSLNYKHYHWQTYGPLFRDLHQFFDELANQVMATLDDFADRVRMIGQNPVAAPAELITTASVEATRGGLTMREMIEEARNNELIVILEMREAAKLATDHDDPGTENLFARNVQLHERHEWALRDLLERGDGLVS
jgi:starvation-inducible DNA-binding protein